MDRDEILEKSRSENGNETYDERERLISINADSVGFGVCILLCIVFGFIYKCNYEFVTVASGVTATYFYKVFKKVNTFNIVSLVFWLILLVAAVIRAFF